MYVLKPNITHAYDQYEDAQGRVLEREVRIDPEDAFRRLRQDEVWTRDLVEEAIVETWDVAALQRVRAIVEQRTPWTFRRWAFRAVEAFAHVTTAAFPIDAVFRGGDDWDFEWDAGSDDIAFADWLVKRALSA
jgi:hypothetical protein